MSEVLARLVGALGIEVIGGDDERLKKLQDASARIAEQFRQDPGLLAPAILAALDSAVASDNPSVVLALSALTAEWKSYETMYTDQPTQLLRAMLFDACDQASEGKNAAIVWLTAADAMPYSQLGKEEAVVRRMLEKCFNEMGEVVTSVSPEKTATTLATTTEAKNQDEYAPFEVDRDQLQNDVTRAFVNGTGLGGAYGPHVLVSPWAEKAANRLHDILADQIDGLATEVLKRHIEMSDALEKRLTAFHADFQTAITGSCKTSTSEQRRLDTLWWYEALYSPSLHKSYRELDPQLACVVMAMDLLDICPGVGPVSVAYVLAEAVARLPGAGYDKPIALTNVITNLAQLRTQLPSSWSAKLAAPLEDGRLSLRDVAIVALRGPAADATILLQRAKIADDTVITLPALARAVFRQEQALRLAAEATA